MSGARAWMGLVGHAAQRACPKENKLNVPRRLQRMSHRTLRHSDKYQNKMSASTTDPMTWKKVTIKPLNTYSISPAPNLDGRNESSSKLQDGVDPPPPCHLLRAGRASTRRASCCLRLGLERLRLRPSAHPPVRLPRGIRGTMH